MPRTRRLVRTVAAAAVATAAVVLVPQPPAAGADPGDATLTVVVDRDVDADGSFDPSVDLPQPGIEITVTDPSGNAVTGATGDDGTFTLEPTARLSGGRYVVVAEIPASLGELRPVPGSDTFQPLSTTADLTAGPQTVRMGVAVATPTESPAAQTSAAPETTNQPAPRFAVGDRVWNDTDRSAGQDPGEPGVGQLSVQLLDSDGDAIRSTVSSAEGHYSFDDLPAGTYSVRFAGIRSGFRLSPPAVGPDRSTDSDPDYSGVTPPFTLGVGEPNVRPSTPDDGVAAAYINPTIDAGVTALRFAVGSRVWSDVNGDGSEQPGEPGAVATVSLYDDSGLVATTTTGADGHYLFSGLAAGRYRVQFSGLPAHRAFTLTGPNSGPGTGSDADVTTGLTPWFTLRAGAPGLAPATDAGVSSADFVNATVNAGLVGRYSLGDTVWRDLNGDGVLDPGEPGLPGVKVELLSSAGTTIDSATTSASGRYTFAGLAAGDYRVRFGSLPAGLMFSAQHAAQNSAVDSDPDSAGLSPVVALGDENPADTTVDAGVTTAANYTPAESAGGQAAPTDTSLSSTGGVAAELPLSGIALVVSGVACIVAGRRQLSS